MIKIAGIILCLIITGCWADHDTLDARGMVHITKAQALSNNNFNQPPSDSSDWYAVSLPDNWNITRPDQGGGVWYRMPVDFPEDASQSMAVLLSNFSMNASIWWDGFQVESGGKMTRPYTRHWHSPLYASLGVDHLKRGRHWLYIRVHGYANDAAGLGDVYFGPESQLLPVYGKIFFMQRTLSILALACTGLLALGALLMWLLRPQQRVFMWITCATSAWFVVISNFVVLNPLMPRFYWESLVDGAIELYSLFLLILVFRILDERHRVLEWSLALFYAVGWMIILVFGNDSVLMAWAMPMHTVVMLTTIYLLGLCIMRWHQQKNRHALLLSLAILTQLVFAAHDWWLVYFDNQLDSMLIMQVGPTLTLLMVGGWMIRSFSRALQASEAHTAHVEAEVERVTASLKLEQEQLAQLQKKQVLSEERERFTRELHDGLGGYLAAISTMLHDGVRDEQLLTRTIDQALLEMRVVMDGIGEECDDAGMLLGMLRHRLQQPLQAWGLQVGWNIIGVPMQCALKDGTAIHLLRIVQEALTNAARHSGADWVEVRASVMNEADQDKLCVEVVDNGCGWNELPAAGNGLSNIRKRAELMEATLEMSSGPDTGVRISLTCPVTLAP